jgi:hypothetical protein
MKKIQIYKITFILVSVFFLSLNSLYSQSAAKIENIKFDAEGSKLVITYDILKFKEGETFEIWVKIKTVSGKEIIPVTMYGDVKKGVSGGAGKRIVWDVESDRVDLNEEFSVEVYGRSDSQQQETKMPKESKEKAPKGEAGGISVGGAMAMSALLPGLGNNRVKGGGAQWLIGIAGYGCIAGSIILNNSAYNAYEDYKVAEIATERDDYFDKAEKNDQFSKILIGGAAAIWVADLIWTGLQASKARKNSKSGISLNYFYDPQFNKPMIGLSYRF